MFACGCLSGLSRAAGREARGPAAKKDLPSTPERSTATLDSNPLLTVIAAPQQEGRSPSPKAPANSPETVVADAAPPEEAAEPAVGEQPAQKLEAVAPEEKVEEQVEEPAAAEPAAERQPSQPSSQTPPAQELSAADVAPFASPDSLRANAPKVEPGDVARQIQHFDADHSEPEEAKGTKQCCVPRPGRKSKSARRAQDAPAAAQGEQPAEQKAGGKSRGNKQRRGKARATGGS